MRKVVGLVLFAVMVFWGVAALAAGLDVSATGEWNKLSVPTYNRFVINSQDVVVGYSLVDQLEPYVALGVAEVNAKTDSAAFKDSGFLYTIGAKGKAATVKTIDVNYNVGRTGIAGMSDENTKMNIAKYFGELSLSKAFDTSALSKGYVASVTPSVGYRFSTINVNSETSGVKDYQNGNLHSMVLGLNADLKNNVSVGINGSVFDEQSIGGKVSYKF